MSRAPSFVRLSIVGLLCLACLCSTGQTAMAAEASDFVTASGTVMYLGGKTFVPRGVNVIDFESFWDPSSTVPGLNWTQEKDFKNFQQAGFNTIRLVVKSDYFQDPNPPHAFSEKGFAWLDKVISLAKKHDQKIILDMHIPTGGQYQDYQIYPGNQVFWNDPWMKGRFVDVWREIARRYADEDTIWAYDLMNEPATVDFKAYQNLMRDTIYSIRLYDQDHFVMLQRGMYVKPDQSWGMKFPQVEDIKQVKSIHFYQPTDFTLQGAPWIQDQKPMVTYPTPTDRVTDLTTSTEDVWDAARVGQELTSAIDEAQVSSTPAVLTEFGAIFPPKLSGQLQWVTDVATTVQSQGVGWLYWNYASPTCDRATALWDQKRLCRPQTWAMLTSLAKLH